MCLGFWKAYSSVHLQCGYGRVDPMVLRDYEEIQPIILSVGEDEEVAIKDVVDYIADAIDYHNIEYDHTKADGQYKKTASNAKLRKYLPEYKFTPMRQGIKETVDWFVKNYDIARK